MTTRKRTMRLYYGPEGHETDLWWDVVVTDAKKAVTVNGKVADALKSHKGVTVGCAISNMAFADRNQQAFPHPCLLAAVTPSRVYIVTRRAKRGGHPSHVTAYLHNYGHITEMNDNGTIKTMVKDNPSLMDRSFTLLPPRLNHKSGRTSGTGKRGTRRGQVFVPRGALNRAVKAGFLSRDVAEQMSRMR